MRPGGTPGWIQAELGKVLLFHAVGKLRNFPLLFGFASPIGFHVSLFSDCFPSLCEALSQMSSELHTNNEDLLSVKWIPTFRSWDRAMYTFLQYLHLLSGCSEKKKEMTLKELKSGDHQT